MRDDRIFHGTLIIAVSCIRETYVYEKRARRVAGGKLGGSLMAPLIYSGRELMYGPLLDVVGTFHSAASRRDKR